MSDEVKKSIKRIKEFEMTSSSVLSKRKLLDYLGNFFQVLPVCLIFSLWLVIVSIILGTITGISFFTFLVLVGLIILGFSWLLMFSIIVLCLCWLGF